MVTDYFFVYSYFSSVRKIIEKKFWAMEIIGNRQKMNIFLQDEKIQSSYFAGLKPNIKIDRLHNQ